MQRRNFLAGTATALAVGGAAGFAGGYAKGEKARSNKAPAIVSRKEIGTTWKVQTSWPGGVGLDVFKAWCNQIVEKTSGELAFTPFGAKDLVGEFQLFNAVENGTLDAMNPFTLYWAGRMPAAVFLCSYPMGLRHPHEWDVFYYSLGGLELARELFAGFNMHYVVPV